MISPTPEQDAIIEAARASDTSIIISAMAGCAKTTSLRLLAKHLPMRPTLALAFNVRIKKELEKGFPGHFEVMTLNGLGHRAWCRAINKRCKVDTNKAYNAIKAVVNDLNLDSGGFSTVSTLVKGARHAGLVPNPMSNQFPGLLPDDWASWEAIADSHYMDISDDVVHAARRALQSLIRQSFDGTIDYDDQIYMSTLFGGVFPRFPITLVDEAQDLSPLNHKQISKAAASRLIVCGDPRQAIYAFRGADSSSMESLRNLRDTWVELPLTTTFRCPKAIVARQQSHAPGFTAAPSAPTGEFHDWTDRQWNIADLQSLYPDKHIAILCRNNAPIIAAALRIIRSGRGCTVLGSEIGKALVSLSKKILSADNIPAETCRQLIETWRARENSINEANGKYERISITNDRADCLLAVLDSGGALTSGQLRGTLTTMFTKENLSITLSTGHKAKGLEWPIVVHLDPWRIPSKWARNAAAEGHMVPMKQDLNLRYVIETRAQQVLINADLEMFS